MWYYGLRKAVISISAFSDTLIKLRKQDKLTQVEAARLMGITRSALAMYETGKREPDFETLELIADFYNVNMDTLYGRGMSRVSEIVAVPQARSEREIDPIWDSLNEDGQKQLCNYGRFLGSQEEYRAKEAPKRPVVITRIIPLLGQSFAAGSPEAPGDLFMEDYSTTDTRAEFAIHVNGNSMEPYLPDGSVALGVKRKPVDGEVGAFYLDGGFLVKQVCQDSQDNIYLFSLNRERSDADETIWHDSGRDLRVVGTILMEERIPLP